MVKPTSIFQEYFRNAPTTQQETIRQEKNTVNEASGKVSSCHWRGAERESELLRVTQHGGRGARI